MEEPTATSGPPQRVKWQPLTAIEADDVGPALILLIDFFVYGASAVLNLTTSRDPS